MRTTADQRERADEAEYTQLAWELVKVDYIRSLESDLSGKELAEFRKHPQDGFPLLVPDEWLSADEAKNRWGHWPVKGGLGFWPGGVTTEVDELVYVSVSILTDVDEAWRKKDARGRIPEIKKALKIRRKEEDASAHPLSEWAKETLKGKQLKVLEILIESDEPIPIPNIAIEKEIGWLRPFDDSFNSLRTAVNRKLKNSKLPWRLSRRNNKARLIQTESPEEKK